MYRATIRFPSKPDRLIPQSQSFSRSYGSGLPTSLTYIHLSTRGCSPWRPDADMGTIWHEGISSYPWIFKFHTRGAGLRKNRGAIRGKDPLSDRPSSQGPLPLKQKRQLFPALWLDSPGW
jgi:hypothetical protein